MIEKQNYFLFKSEGFKSEGCFLTTRYKQLLLTSWSFKDFHLKIRVDANNFYLTDV